MLHPVDHILELLLVKLKDFLLVDGVKVPEFFAIGLDCIVSLEDLPLLSLILYPHYPRLVLSLLLAGVLVHHKSVK